MSTTADTASPPISAAAALDTARGFARLYRELGALHEFAEACAGLQQQEREIRQRVATAEATLADLKNQIADAETGIGEARARKAAENARAREAEEKARAAAEKLRLAEAAEARLQAAETRLAEVEAKLQRARDAVAGIGA
ncbi:hypothetical protein [Falsiroseomonas sp.]|uniref:hypothetical protein n=1 Tax=Falsiroseomonas sp. TaxID=2870721 RepID=UPI003564E42E